MGKIQGDALKAMDEAAESFKKMDDQRDYQRAQAENRKYKPGEPMVR